MSAKHWYRWATQYDQRRRDRHEDEMLHHMCGEQVIVQRVDGRRDCDPQRKNPADETKGSPTRQLLGPRSRREHPSPKIDECHDQKAGKRQDRERPLPKNASGKFAHSCTILQRLLAAFPCSVMQVPIIVGPSSGRHHALSSCSPAMCHELPHIARHRPLLVGSWGAMCPESEQGRLSLMV